jgi:hypothetical protein
METKTAEDLKWGLDKALENGNDKKAERITRRLERMGETHTA